MSRVHLAALVALAVGAGAVAFAVQDEPKKPQADPKKKEDPNTVEIVPASELPTFPGVRLSGGGTYDNQPAVAETSDGTVWVASVRYQNGKADEVTVVSRKGE